MKAARNLDRRRRRALSHTGGAVEVAGDDALFDDLRYALSTPDDEASTRAHVHGFHSYPARMHPVTARRFIERLARPGQAILDPFCGSGTVLVEGRLAGCRVVGIDANPLAVELSWLKVRGTTEAERGRILEAARDLVARAEARRRAKAGSTRRYGSEDTSMFDPHVLLELDGLRSALEALPDHAVRRTLGLVLSAILVKVSRKPGDTAERYVPRRIASGFTLRLFLAKTSELLRKLAEFDALLSAPPANRADLPVVRLGDARRLEGVPPASIDLVLTSPPYPGNYDYLAQHAARLRWLGMDPKGFASVEIGARRNLERLGEEEAVLRWSDDLAQVLGAIAQKLRRDGSTVLLIADSVISRRPVFADDLVRELSVGAGFRVAAIGSQARPHFHPPTARAFARRPRREHAIVLRPATPARRDRR